MAKNMVVLYDYLFHYNPYRQKWFAMLREQKEAYFNGELNIDTLPKSKNFYSLIKELTTVKEEEDDILHRGSWIDPDRVI
jgi:hypothetical protein